MDPAGRPDRLIETVPSQVPPSDVTMQESDSTVLDHLADRPQRTWIVIVAWLFFGVPTIGGTALVWADGHPLGAVVMGVVFLPYLYLLGRMSWRHLRGPGDPGRR